MEKIKLVTFDDNQKISLENEKNTKNMSFNKYKKRVNDVKNDKIKKSLIELTKVFKEK